jgi:hypothetical protein
MEDLDTRLAIGRAGVTIDPRCTALGADMPTGVVLDGPRALEEPLREEWEHKHSDQGGQADPWDVRVHHLTPWPS